MPRNSAVEPPERDELLALRKDYTRDEIAAMYGVSVSIVKRWISRLNVHVEIHSKTGPRSRASQAKIRMSSKMPEDDGMSNMDKAKKKLGDRLKEDRYKGYILDGRLTKAEDVLRAAGFSVPK